jgi:hypothetical protein
MPNTGALLLSGDAVHFKDNWENRRVPDINFNKEQTAASLQRMTGQRKKPRETMNASRRRATPPCE